MAFDPYKEIKNVYDAKVGYGNAVTEQERQKYNAAANKARKTLENYGYKDLAGNEGETLTNANINNGISAIKLDKTAPTYKTYKGKITYDKYRIEPIIIDGELYFFGETTFNFNDNVFFCS